jgi:hypothetical protein
MPELSNSAAVRSRLLTVASFASPVEKTAARFFYYEARRFVGWLAGVSGLTVNQVAAVVAALSPRSVWNGNQLSAIALCCGFERAGINGAGGGGISGTGRDVGRAQAIVNGADIPTTLRGPKVTAFYKNLLSPGCDVGIPVDRHLARALYGDSISEAEISARLKNGGYRAAEDAISGVAVEMSLRPIELANRLWYVMRRLARSSGQHSLPTANLQWRPLYPGGSYRLSLHSRNIPHLDLLPNCPRRPWLEETPFSDPAFGNETCDDRGRVKVFLGKGHKYANRGGYQWRARLVVSYALERRLLSCEHVHHIETRSFNNDSVDKLELREGAEHGSYHARIRTLAGYRAADGRFVEYDVECNN